MGKLTDSLKSATQQAERIKDRIKEFSEIAAELGYSHQVDQEILDQMDESLEDAKSTVESLEQDLKETIALLQEN